MLSCRCKRRDESTARRKSTTKPPADMSTLHSSKDSSSAPAPFPDPVAPSATISQSMPIHIHPQHPANHPYPSRTPSAGASPTRSTSSSTTDLLAPPIFKRTGSAADLYLRTVNSRYGTSSPTGESLSPPKWTPRGLRPNNRGSRNGATTPSLGNGTGTGTGSLSSSPGPQSLGAEGAGGTVDAAVLLPGMGPGQISSTAMATAAMHGGYQKYVPVPRSNGSGTGVGGRMTAESSLKRLINASRAPGRAAEGGAGH